MRWTQPHNLKRPLKGQDGKLDHPNRGSEEGPVMKVTTIGIDLAKDVFGLHGVDGEGRVTFKKRLVRSRLLEFLSQLPRCLVGLEACSSAHYWAREIERLGHRVRLMSPRFVKPYRKSDKNDANDAEAICEAVTRASMRFVPIKSEAQHEVQALHRVREQLLKSRTALVNQEWGRWWLPLWWRRSAMRVNSRAGANYLRGSGWSRASTRAAIAASYSGSASAEIAICVPS